MAETGQEVVIVSTLNDDQCAFSLWNLRTANLIKSYKPNQQQGCHCLVKAGQDYVLTSQQNKQVINVWEWKKDQIQMKIVCPEKVTAIACTPDGNYCVVALLEKIFIWQTATGNLMGILSRHYQNVTHLKFTDDGSHFVSTGDDNLVIVWSLSSALSPWNSTASLMSDQKPIHTWSNHTLPVTGIHLTCGGIRCRVATCSLDQTCKLYDMSSGHLLCSFLFDTGLSAVTLDPSECFLFVGDITGKIHALNLSGMKAKKEHTSVDDSIEKLFINHSKEVTALSVNATGDTLISGAADQIVRFWHIRSGQCIKQLPFKGRVTNVKVFRASASLTTPVSRPPQPIANFKRNLYEPQVDAAGSSAGDNLVPVVLKDIDKQFLVSPDCNGKAEKHENEDMALVMKIVDEKKLERNTERSDKRPKEIHQWTQSELVERVEKLESLVRILYGINANRVINDLPGCR